MDEFRKAAEQAEAENRQLIEGIVDELKDGEYDSERDLMVSLVSSGFVAGMIHYNKEVRAYALSSMPGKVVSAIGEAHQKLTSYAVDSLASDERITQARESLGAIYAETVESIRQANARLIEAAVGVPTELTLSTTTLSDDDLTSAAIAIMASAPALFPAFLFYRNDKNGCSCIACTQRKLFDSREGKPSASKMSAAITRDFGNTLIAMREFARWAIDESRAKVNEIKPAESQGHIDAASAKTTADDFLKQLFGKKDEE